MKAYTKHRTVSVSEARIEETGGPAVAVVIKEASAYVVFTDPELLTRLAKLLDEKAAWLSREQQSNHSPVLLPSLQRKLEGMHRAGVLGV